ncbi:MAG: hypothetical protein IJO43_00840 [Bacilli bacterium]|nr:hypothetical protein [Bacilli bacterium]
MEHLQLIGSNMKNNLVQIIQGVDFGAFSKDDLDAVRNWAIEVQRRADLSTLEGECVGYTYSNLDALNSRLPVDVQEGPVLVKSANY